MRRCGWVVVTVMTGCGIFGGNGTECGPGTEEIDGQCVAIVDPGDDDDDDTTVDTDDTDTDDTDTESVPSDPKAPNILSVSSNLTRMTDDDGLSITAIVTDPDGIEDLIGGELLAPDGASYGAFATSAQEGAYQVELTWTDLDAVDAIEFDGEIEREFVVRFYDVAGHTVDKPYTIELYCDEGAACDGRCTDTSADADHCGSCGNSCDPDFVDGCVQGGCVVTTSCSTQLSQNCDDVCAFEGHSGCVEATYLSPDGFYIEGAGMAAFGNQCQFEQRAFSDCSRSVNQQTESQSFLCFCRE